MNFKQENPPINIGADISSKSFQIIKEELKNYPLVNKFSSDELEVIVRLIHTSSCFTNVLENIFFTKDAIPKLQQLLIKKAKIIVDVNMIKTGLNDFYLKTYDNEVICYVNEPSIYKSADKNKTTRSYAAVIKAIKKYKNEPMIFVCGNAPTFIYATINTLLKEGVNLANVALVLFPVGFVNVLESKEYGKRFSNEFDVASIIMQGRFGSSTMSIAVLHAVYKLIKNYNKDENSNGK